MGEITLPFLVMHGECDRVTATLGSKLFFEEAISTDKEIKIYPRVSDVHRWLITLDFDWDHDMNAEHCLKYLHRLNM